MAAAVKVGPWGAPGGNDQDIQKESKPQSLVSITICSSTAFGGPILGFSFVYVDQTDVPIAVGPWGTIDPEQRITTIKMDGGEYLYQLRGIASESTLFWLELVTNHHVYTAGTAPGPTPTFSVPLENGKVVAFFGRSEDTPGAKPSFKALGIYVAPLQGSPVKVGPWGGSGGGVPVDITTPVQLKSVTVYGTENGDGRIYGFSFTYIDLTGQAIQAGPWGTVNGQEHGFELKPGEYVKDITGTFDDDGVTSLKFTTNQHRVYGPFGAVSGTAFSVPLPDDRDDKGAIVGFFGRSGESLVALGVYVGLWPNPEP